jgi:hypothetical protein
MMIKRFSLTKHSHLLVLLVIGLCLLIPAVLLSGRIARLTKDNLKSQAALNQVLPGLDKQTLGQFQQEVNQLLEAKLLPLTYLFDPPEKGIKKDYDPTIYFVDELDKISRSLKTKAAGKQVNYTDLGFKEKLPDEKEARYLLKQLYALAEVVSRGIDCGVDFIAITPQAVEDLGGLAGIKVARTSLELTAPTPALLEFIIQISQITPLISIESLLLKSQDSVFKLEITLNQTLIEADWKDKGIPFHPLNIKEAFLEQGTFINTLRASNPFSVPSLEETAELPIQVGSGQPKRLPRFLYQGKAMLKSKEVAVIEDTLNQKTVFLAPQERIGDFILIELTGAQIILKNINNNQEIIIKREEK